MIGREAIINRNVCTTFYDMAFHMGSSKASIHDYKKDDESFTILLEQKLLCLFSGIKIQVQYGADATNFVIS